MSMLLRITFQAVAVLGALFCLQRAALADDAAWKIWQSEGVHALMRHAIAPGTGDPANFTLGDCTTQRNLDDTGRKQASQTGKRIQEQGVEITTILTSQWCRCVETARLLGLGPIQEEPALNSFFRNRSSEETQSRQVREHLANLAENQKVLLVTHQVNITALTGIFPRSGEIILFRLADNGTEIEVLSRLMP
jgi:phosphohistidine phosphatase SixA